MLFRLLFILLFSVITAANRTHELDANFVCGFANRGNGRNESQHTYFALNKCNTLGNAMPVESMYRDPKCDCAFYE